MASDLVYLSFLVTSAEYVEDKVQKVSGNVYGAARTRLPSVCTPLVLKLEHLVKPRYTGLRKLLGRVGEETVGFVDDKLGEAVEWTAKKLPGAAERCTEVRDFAKATASRISETWERHGLVRGTFVLALSFLMIFYNLWKQVWHHPVVQKQVKAADASDTMKDARAYYNKNIDPCISQISRSVKQTAQKTREIAWGTTEFVTNFTGAAVDTVVGTDVYAKAYDLVAFVMKQVASTDVYHKVAAVASPCVRPAWETMKECVDYDYLAHKFTPPKKE